jgi:hypothetical protein
MSAKIEGYVSLSTSHLGDFIMNIKLCLPLILLVGLLTALTGCQKVDGDASSADQKKTEEPKAQ